MAFVSSQKSRLLLGDFNMSATTQSVDGGVDVEMYDVSVLTSTAKEFQPGRDGASFSASGLLDVDATANLQFDQLHDWKAATAAEPVTYAPNGLALGAELWMVGAYEASIKTASPVGGMVTFGLEVQPDGPPDPIGRSLHDLTARTSDASGSSYDGTAATANGGVGHLHVTAFSGFSAADIIVEDSANDSTWATILTFTTVAGITSQRSAISGAVRRYLRVSWDVTGTGSITFAVGFARR